MKFGLEETNFELNLINLREEVLPRWSIIRVNTTANFTSRPMRDMIGLHHKHHPPTPPLREAGK